MSACTLLARQPIFDTKLNVHAYELLFRNDQHSAADIDGDAATSAVILNTFTEAPIGSVLNGKKAFVNFTRNLILQPPELDPHQVVIEVLEDVILDEELVSALGTLKKQGFTIALDDFEYSSQADEALSIADLLKLDVLALTPNELQEHARIGRQHNCLLLAEKVEDKAMFEHCKALGFDYFQGYFFSKPELIKGQKLSNNKQAVMELLAKLQNPQVDVDEVVAKITLDPVLSLKLLRLINSAMFGLSTEIDSIKQAVNLLGLIRIRTWISLLALTSDSDKPSALTTQALTRARMCQLQGQYIEKNQQADNYFTAGLFSSMDAFLDVKLDLLLADISLSSDIENGILKYQGNIGLSLHTAIACERALWGKIHWQALEKHDIGERQIQQWCFAALEWSQDVLKTISA